MMLRLDPGRVRAFALLAAQFAALFLAFGCARHPPRAPAVEPKTSSQVDTRPPAILRHLPADVWGLLLLHDPLELVDTLGREQLMAQQAVAYERASGFLLRRYGVNLLHPEGWRSLGLDPHGPAGVASFDVDQTVVFFATPLERERVKAAIHRLAQHQQQSAHVDVINETLVLTLQNPKVAFLIRDDIVMILSSRQEMKEQSYRLAALLEKESLARSSGFTEALHHTGRGEAGLVVFDAHAMAAGAGGPLGPQLLGSEDAPLVAALDTDEVGLRARWALPLADDALIRRLLVPQESKGLAVEAKQVPLLALSAGVDLEVLAGQVRALGLRGAPLELLEATAAASDGELSVVVQRKLVQQVEEAILESRRVQTDVPAVAELGLEEGASGTALLESWGQSSPLKRWLRRESDGYHLAAGQVRGAITPRGDALRFVSTNASTWWEQHGSKRWKHPHADALAELLDAKDRALTVAVDTALLDLVFVPLPGAHSGPLSPSSLRSPIEGVAPVAKEEAAAVLPPPGQKPEAPAESTPEAEAEEARQRELERRLQTDPSYQEALARLDAAETELEGVVLNRQWKLLMRRFHPARPALIGVLHAEVQELGLLGEGALVVNTPTLAEWLPAYVKDADAPNTRTKEDYDREQELRKRVREASSALEEERRRIEDEMEEPDEPEATGF